MASINAPIHPAGPNEPAYRFAVYDLLSREQLVEHMPFVISGYSRSLPEAGTAAAALNVADVSVQKLDPWGKTQPRRSTLGIIRGDVMVAEYLIWQRPPYKATEKKLNVNASELRSYFDHRVLRPEGGPGKTKTLSFTQKDQFEIFRALIADCQGVTFQGLSVGNIGVILDASQTSGVLRDRKDVDDTAGAYHGYEFSSYGDLLDNLANVDNGFEWRIDSFLDADRNLQRILRLGYPYLGHGPDDDAVVLEYPGVIIDYQWPEDGTSSANYVATIGAGEEAAMKWSEAADSGELLGGYPLLERTTSYKSVSVQATLTDHAIADVKALTGDVVLPSVTMRGWPNVSPGDYIKLRIADEARFAGSSINPFETFLRAIDIKVTPGPPETTTITMEAPRTPGETA